MRWIGISLSLILVLTLLVSCTKRKRYHQADLPDPKLFEANFYDIDTNGDGKVTTQELKDYFPEAEPQVFMTLDLNRDQVVDREEWRKFEEAHAAKTKQRKLRNRSSGY